MKYKITLFFLLSFFITELYSQDKKNEISLGAGFWSSDQIIGTMVDIIVGDILTDTKISNTSYYGAFHIGYKYSVTERIQVGGIFAYDRGISDALKNNVAVGKLTRDYYSFAMESNYNFINKEKFRLYSCIGLGFSFYTQNFENYETNSSNKKHLFALNYQISPVGVKFGNSFGGFVELGFGYKGVILAGLFLRF